MTMSPTGEDRRAAGVLFWCVLGLYLLALGVAGVSGEWLAGAVVAIGAVTRVAARVHASRAAA